MQWQCRSPIAAKCSPCSCRHWSKCNSRWVANSATRWRTPSDQRRAVCPVENSRTSAGRLGPTDVPLVMMGWVFVTLGLVRWCMCSTGPVNCAAPGAQHTRGPTWHHKRATSPELLSFSVYSFELHHSCLYFKVDHTLITPHNCPSPPQWDRGRSRPACVSPSGRPPLRCCGNQHSFRFGTSLLTLFAATGTSARCWRNTLYAVVKLFLWVCHRLTVYITLDKSSQRSLSALTNTGLNRFVSTRLRPSVKPTTPGSSCTCTFRPTLSSSPSTSLPGRTASYDGFIFCEGCLVVRRGPRSPSGSRTGGWTWNLSLNSEVNIWKGWKENSGTK